MCGTIVRKISTLFGNTHLNYMSEVDPAPSEARRIIDGAE